jgi:putative endonuclease
MRRVQEHKHGIFDGFTKKYKIHNLVYYESTSDIHSALNREKQLKNWHRKWKLDLIEKDNPNWHDLSELDPEPSSG